MADTAFISQSRDFPRSSRGMCAGSLIVECQLVRCQSPKSESAAHPVSFSRGASSHLLCTKFTALRRVLVNLSKGGAVEYLCVGAARSRGRYPTEMVSFIIPPSRCL
jgi:hypothetical protein